MDGIEQKSASNYKQWFLIALVVGLVLVVISGGIWVYQKTMKKKPPNADQITPMPIQEETTITPETEITPGEVTTIPSAKAELKIQILNGGGVKGEAGRAAQLLEKVGFKNIKTGNADRFDYEQTEIKVKADEKQFTPEIIEALAGNYSVSSDLQDLDNKETYDVVIVIGKNKGGE